MINCPYCEGENPIFALFCQECGKKILPVRTFNHSENHELIEKILKISNDDYQSKVRHLEDNPELMALIIENLSGKSILDTDNSQKIQNSVGITNEINATNLMMNTIIMDDIMWNYELDYSVKKALVSDLIMIMEHNRTADIPDKFMPHDIALALSKHLDNNVTLAEIIEHTEIIKASNLASWSQDRAEGCTHFTVSNRTDSCEKCAEKYEGVVFIIDQVDMVPPMHPNCACVPYFFTDESEAQDWADELRADNEAERHKYEEPNAKGYIAYNIANEKLDKLHKNKNNAENYLEVIPILQRALEENISELTMAKVYRMMGEIYLKNDEKRLAMINFEKALSYNPKVGVKRLYDKLNLR